MTTLTDENNGTGLVSLREAVAVANMNDTITFSVTGTIQLLGTAGLGQIVINKNLTIQGPGANLLTIRAFDPDVLNNSNGRRVFLVEDNTGTANVTISGVTLTNGDPALVDENDGGGAILNRENLTLNACVLTGNFSPNGGAIYSTASELRINDCTFNNNDGADGAALLVSGGDLVVARTQITNNRAINAGGGLMSRNRPVAIVDSTVSGNTADEAGGGIYQYGNSLTVTRSTISGNGADNDHDAIGSGGGIFNATGSLLLTSCTISGNSAGEGGAGIFSNTIQSVVINFSTITGNIAGNAVGSSGGGINSANVAYLGNTIVAGNLKGASTRDDVFGTINAYYCLIGDQRAENVLNSGGSLIGTTASPIDPKLGFLVDNGGPTLTHALLSGSPAYDAGDPGMAAGIGIVPLFDQRGAPFSRVLGRIDMGAVETQNAPGLIGDYNRNQSVDAADYVLWRKTSGTSVTSAYDGADGDGNLAVNSDDYTVWRARFGNAPPAAGSAADEVSGEEVASASVAQSGGDEPVTSFALAPIETSRVGDTATGATVHVDREVIEDRAEQAALLLAIGDVLGGVEHWASGKAEPKPSESPQDAATADSVFGLCADELTLSLLAL